MICLPFHQACDSSNRIDELYRPRHERLERVHYLRHRLLDRAQHGVRQSADELDPGLEHHLGEVVESRGDLSPLTLDQTASEPCLA